MDRILFLAVFMGCQEATDSSEPWPVDPSTGLRVSSLPPVPELEEWEGNESTEARRALGQAIFNDRRLSGSGLATCTACHLPFGAFTSGLEVDIPDRAWPEMSPTLARNTPSLLNQVYAEAFHWDGRPSDHYEVWVLPFGEAQMNLTDLPQDDIWSTDDHTAQVRLQERFVVDVPGYVDWFYEAYGVDIRDHTPEEVWDLAGRAIAVYMREVVSLDAPFDRWNQGESDAMDAAAIRGLELFTGDAGCQNCHSGSLFSDFQYHNLSRLTYDEDGEPIDPGRARITGDDADLGKFLTPMLRSVSLTSPYFHDGGVFALKDAVRYHTSLEARLDPDHDPILDQIPELTEDELDDLVAFLKALRGESVPMEYQSVLPPLP